MFSLSLEFRSGATRAAGPGENLPRRAPLGKPAPLIGRGCGASFAGMSVPGWSQRPGPLDGGLREALPEALRRVTGKPAVPDSARSTPDAWWCTVTDARVLVLCDGDCRGSVARHLEAVAHDLPGTRA